MKNPQSTQNTLMRLTSPFQYRYGKNQIICFLLCGTGSGITKNIFRYLGRERELPKSFPAIRDGNGKLKKASRWEIYRNGNSNSCLEGLLPMCLHCLVNSFKPVLNGKQNIARIAKRCPENISSVV